LPQDAAATLHFGIPSAGSFLTVWSIIQAAGWPIWPLILASVIALALIFRAAVVAAAEHRRARGLVDKCSRSTA